MKKGYQDTINSLTDRELLFHLYITQVILLTVSILLVLFFYGDISFIGTLFRWDDLRIITIGITGGILVVVIDVLLMHVLPTSYYDDGGLNKRIFANRNIFHIAFIALVVAFCEELLFRGIIQTQIGLIFASIIFALVHFRYLYNWFLFVNIIILSLIIGFIFEKTQNLGITFIMHFIIDFLLGAYLMIINKDKKKS